MEDINIRIPVDISDLAIRLGVTKELIENTIDNIRIEKMKESGMFRPSHIQKENYMSHAPVAEHRYAMNYIYVEYKSQEKEQKRQEAIGQLIANTELASLAVGNTTDASRRLPKEINILEEVKFFREFYLRYFPDKASPVESLLGDYAIARQTYSGNEVIMAVALYTRLYKYHWTKGNPVGPKQFLSKRSKVGPVDYIAESLALVKTASDFEREQGKMVVQGEILAFQEEEVVYAKDRIKKALSALSEEKRKEVTESWKIK